MKLAIIGLVTLSWCTACSQQPAQTQKSRFSQEGFDAISKACGLPKGALLLDGTRSVRFGSAVTGNYDKLRCVQAKIREVYYPGAAPGHVASELNVSEGDNAQTH